MSVARKTAFILACLGACLIPAAGAAAATPSPAWRVTAVPLPTHFTPGATGILLIEVGNLGGAPVGLPVTLTDTLPSALKPLGATASTNDSTSGASSCNIVVQTVTCTSAGPIGSGRYLEAQISIEVDPLADPGELSDHATISGGGLPDASVDTTTTIGSSPPPFEFLPQSQGGPDAPASEADGTPATQAANHPYQLSMSVGFPTQTPNGALVAAGHAKTIRVDLPRGLAVGPSATPELCTEAELVTMDSPGCPADSVVGTVTVTTLEALPKAQTAPLYNMVTPPGVPAMLGFDPVGVGLFIHLIGSIRTEGDYGITGISSDTLAFALHPVFGARVELWGDPSSPMHDHIRGNCVFNGGASCPVEPIARAFVTMPPECSGNPPETGFEADSWEQPGAFLNTTRLSSDLQSTPYSLQGCQNLEFQPTVEAAATTTLADSPSGLDFNLHQPQSAGAEELATGLARNLSVSMPEGMVLNPSASQGTEGCSASQIGLLTPVGESPAHLSGSPAECPAASRIGSLEVRSPALARHEADGTLVTDPETGEPVAEPLSGSVYLAEPFDNPFGSLLAIYLAVEDARTGIVAKVPAKIETDPQTGQLRTLVAENPELPIEDVDLELFGGSRAPLITPPTCGTHTTATTLTPWSSPQTPDAHPESSFQITAQPGGGPCPQNAGAAPNSPGFSAGTLNPQAGAYSPFALKLSREDGSQRFSAVDTTLPIGLIGKLAGIAECSEAQIAAAQARSHPEEGKLERESPSCPLGSEVGTVTVGAGAGPDPVYTAGHAYLAGPYKGAPVSLAIVTPAIAGPFDLGTVVVRVALRVDPASAQIHAVSDPLPQVLQGIPLDIRSVALKMDRPQFILNPTSCERTSITGTAVAASGQAVSLSERFQIGHCKSLAFKPKLSLRLKGSVKRTSHPRLIANLSARSGEANIARAQVKLPGAVFLDQSHIRTVCTRVQFAADACPEGSVYGKVSATTPLLDQPLAGSVYLRSSSHELPDLVAKLNGPTSLPIEIDLVGRTDSVKGALRNTFEAVPDAPVSKFSLELFGGKRGLVEMSDGFCSDRRANVQLDGQNGKAYDTRPMVGAKCPEHKKHRKKGKGGDRGSR